MHPRSSKPCCRMIWRYAHADFPLAQQLLFEVDWDRIIADDVDSSCLNWQSKFLEIMEICIPKKVLPSVQAMCRKNALFKRAMRSRADSDYAKYREARNNVVSSLRSAKSAYFHKPSNSKKFWQAVKYLKNNCSSIPTLTHHNVSYESDEEKAAVLNSHFISCFNNTVEPLQVPDEETYISHQVPVDLSNIMCSEEEVEAMLHSLDTTKANGKDGISARMLKETPSITKLFNLSIQLCRIPHA